MIKVSIVVPVYNVEEYLRACLESLIGQTLKDIEIICVNDGSTDDSLNILKEYEVKDSRIVIINQQNQGISVARNNALKIAKGEYIGFVDSDDWVDLNFFEKLYNVAVKNDCDIAAGGIEWNKSDGELDFVDISFKNLKIYTKTPDKYKITKVAKFAYIWNKIYKKELFDKLKLEFEPDRYYEDMMFSHRVLHESGRLVTVPGVFYHYRLNPLSAVNTDSPKKREDFKCEVLKTINYVIKNKIKVNLAKYYPQFTEVIKVWGIPILRIKSWENYSIYYLFRVIPFMTISKKKFF